MSFFTGTRIGVMLSFTFLLAIICSPVWAVKYFINQDGSGHLYTSYVMLELLRGNGFFAENFALNSFAVPNASGHWLMTGLLAFIPPLIVTKIIITLTLALFAAAVVWLRYRTAGDQDIGITLLLAFAIGFNWLWIQGNYNYVFAVATSTFALGLFYRWREEMTKFQVAILAILLLVTFIGHLISFTALVGSLFMLAIFSRSESRFRSVFGLIVALIPTIPLIIAYSRISKTEGVPFIPNWQSLTGPLTMGSIAKQLVWADPFVFMSRKTLPFLSINSTAFAIFTPVIWIFAAALLMFAATVYVAKKDKSLIRRQVPFIILTALGIIGALFGPDDFGMQNGSILRERVLIATLIFFVPVFRFNGHRALKIASGASLGFVLCFQTLALWDYSLTTQTESADFYAARQAIPENASIASVVFDTDSMRFHSAPATQLVNYLGINRNVTIWDNYELGHYMFPVTTLRPEDRKYVFELTTTNVFNINNPDESFDEKLASLEKALADGNQRIELLVVCGNDGRLDAVLQRWYDLNPVFANRTVRVLKHW
jgi:hypothetical protein